MNRIIFLDTTPLSIVTNAKVPKITQAALQWVADLGSAGHKIVVPAIADFELRRELIRAGNTPSLESLDTFNQVIPDRYLPLTDSALKRAAELWAQARNRGILPADPKELNGDVLIAAQMLEYQFANGLTDAQIMIATVNVGHLALFVPAKVWTEIEP